MIADDSNAADAPEPDASAPSSSASEPEPAGGFAEQRCWNCGSPLPEGALFCGECGSAVGARAARPGEQSQGAGRSGPVQSAAEAPAEFVLAEEPDQTALPPHGDPVLEAAGGDERARPAAADAARAERSADADQSGLAPHGDALLETSDAVGTGRSEPDQPVLEASDEADAVVAPDTGSAADAEARNAEAQDREAQDEDSRDVGAGRGDAPSGDEPDDGAHDNAATAVQPVLDDESGTPPHGDPGATRTGFAAGVVSAEGRRPAGDGNGDDGSDDDSDGDVHDGPELLAPLTPEERFAAERLLDPDSQADKFVLQFSTGESATVYGSGLVGRNPVAEPGEYVDHFVVIRDPGRSVSKTHLEFGQDGGSFWVLDRFSGNGSVLREPGGAPRRCEPGRRYSVQRGTRIEIGDQFFVVS